MVIKKNLKEDFKTLDEVNERMILKHREAFLHGYIGAVH
jgi:hypothetical protein